MLKAYFDESGPSGRVVVAIAGYVGTERMWTDIEAPWCDELALFAKKGVKTFHMTECIAQKDEFARLERPFVNGIVITLSQLSGQSGLTPISSAVVLDDWDKVVTDPEFLRQFPKPFDLCFEDIVRQLAEWGKRYTPQEHIAPMFAYQREHHSRMSEMARVYGGRDWYKKVGPISFGYPDQVFQLQAADLLVHLVNLDIQNRRYGPISGPTIALYNATGGRFTHGQWFDEEGLASTVKRFKETGEIYHLADVL